MNGKGSRRGPCPRFILYRVAPVGLSSSEPTWEVAGRVGIYGCFLIIAIAVSTISIYKYRILRVSNAVHGLLLALFFVAIIISQTRATLISVSITLGIIFSLSYRHKVKRNVILSALCFLLVFAFSSDVSQEILFNLKSMGTVSVEKRLVSYLYALKVFLSVTWTNIPWQTWPSNLSKQGLKEISRNVTPLNFSPFK